jgi:hypothetical protein
MLYNLLITQAKRFFVWHFRLFFVAAKNNWMSLTDLFYTYWKEMRKAVDAKRKDEKNNAKPKLHGASHKSLKAWLPWQPE